VSISVSSGILIKATGNDQWAKRIKRRKCTITAEHNTQGDIVADNISTIEMVLKNNSNLSGAINSSNTAKSISLTLDSTSKWSVTQDSYLTSLSGISISADTIENIIGNGHTVYYDSTSYPQLGGKTYSLNRGGQLTPKNNIR